MENEKLEISNLIAIHLIASFPLYTIIQTGTGKRFLKFPDPSKVLDEKKTKSAKDKTSRFKIHLGEGHMGFMGN